MNNMDCGIKRILQFNDILELGPIKVFDVDGADITNRCMYSWSSDLVCWTNWMDYATYMNISKNVEEDMYLRVLLFGSFGKISIHNIFTTCYTICIDQSNPFLQDFCGNENLFQPYNNLDCALQLQQQLSDSIICMFGIPIFYFRVSPDATTADYTFKEYVLHNVTDVKRIQLMIPDGTMPSSNPKFTALDFDWETDWDVEVGKTQFATAFGDTAFPKNRDFIYIPMMKRMWTVSSAYDEKNENLMWRSTTWKLSLVKYEEHTNIDIPSTMDELLDGWLVNKYEDTFGYKEKQEQERESGVTQVNSPTYAATNLFDISMDDAIRQKYSREDVSIVDYTYNHHGNVVARNVYKFKKPSATVLYQNGYCGADGTLSFILQTQGMPTEDQNIITIGPIQVQLKFQSGKDEDNESKKDRYILIFNNMKAYIEPFATQLVIIRWNKTTYTTNISVYEYTHQAGVAKYMLRPEMYWFNEGPTHSLTGMYNLDFETAKNMPCYIQPYPCMMTNIKLYNKDLGEDGAIRESIKYTTQHPACIINDLARPITSGHGYAVR